MKPRESGVSLNEETIMMATLMFIFFQDIGAIDVEWSWIVLPILLDWVVYDDLQRLNNNKGKRK